MRSCKRETIGILRLMTASLQQIYDDKLGNRLNDSRSDSRFNNKFDNRSDSRFDSRSLTTGL